MEKSKWLKKKIDKLDTAFEKAAKMPLRRQRIFRQAARYQAQLDEMNAKA
jgi:hypothetical protein